MSVAAPAIATDKCSPAAHILVFGGILLILTGMLLGEVFAIFISHVDSAQVRREWVQNVLPAIEHHNLLAMNTGLERIQDLMERRGRIMDAHSHVVAYGFLALTLALLQKFSRVSERTRRWLALCIVIGGIAQSGFVFVSYYVRGWTFLLSDIGGGLIVLGVLGNVLGFWGARSRPGVAGETLQLLSSPSSQILLCTGACLILAGMAFGFYYAWVFVSRHEPQQMVLLDRALDSAVSSDASGATASIVDYRRLQSRIAIVTAAHSHVIEMGIMAMLLAFVQQFLFLSDTWKRRWAIVFCIGAAAMPVCTYCAAIFGLVFAGFADTFGMMSVVALFAMLYGLIRYTGARAEYVA